MPPTAQHPSGSAGTPLRKRRRRSDCGVKGVNPDGAQVVGVAHAIGLVPGPTATSFGSYEGPRPANTCVPLLPMYATSTDIVGVTWRWIVAFHASRVGKR